jgi:hypothetical protein
MAENYLNALAGYGGLKGPVAGIGSGLFGGNALAARPLGAGARALLGIDADRRAFTEREKVEVWMRGRFHYSLNPADWRYDDADNLICWDDYGKANATHGWEIDHIVPLSRGGTNALSNLRPLHCRLNRSLGGMLGAGFRGLR